jgi:hypothetical protein
LARSPIGNKDAKAALADTTTTEKTHSSITKCLAEVSSTLLIRDKKDDERWATLLKRKEEKMELKKCKRGLLPVDRVDSWNGSPDAGGAQLLQRHDPR